jgi:hypothetical protein
MSARANIKEHFRDTVSVNAASHEPRLIIGSAANAALDQEENLFAIIVTISDGSGCDSINHVQSDVRAGNGDVLDSHLATKHSGSIASSFLDFAHWSYSLKRFIHKRVRPSRLLISLVGVAVILSSGFIFVNTEKMPELQFV